MSFSEGTWDSQGCTDTITVTFTATDECGLTSSQDQTFVISDTTSPELITEFPAPISVSCDNIPDAADLAFADNCSTNVTVTFTEEYMYTTNDTEEYEIKRTWTAVDECGNPAAVVEQIVTVTIDEFVIPTTADACVDDGTVDLNQFASDLDEDSSWSFISGVTNDIVLNDNIFDPSNLLDFTGDYVFSYTYTSPTGCLETTEVTINVNDECVVFPCTSDDIIISKAVTPNGDSYNQSFDIDADPGCGFRAEVKIFNRWGALIFESADYPIGINATGSPDSLKWEGQANGAIGNADTAPNGTYYYIVTLKNSTGNSGVGLPPFTGPVYLGTK
ncbi:hypothetical protein GCM10022257_24380 [Hyunsoonleella aestuarii]|uniref:Gliding motility-associated C-terminal domain-containing protein n=3 Tax=Hyunsoonleella aestuarii TaxID=912802 RepID=A0ABP8EE11_9FLAO